MTKTKLVAVLAIGVVFVVIGVLNLRDRLSAPAVADDGVEWVDGANGPQARSISPDSPLRWRSSCATRSGVFFVDDEYANPARRPSLFGLQEVTPAEDCHVSEQQGLKQRTIPIRHQIVLKNFIHSETALRRRFQINSAGPAPGTRTLSRVHRVGLSGDRALRFAQTVSSRAYLSLLCLVSRFIHGLFL